jgi:8-oxo-dGTP pyrophosphatase MutT (NUDIX family)
VIFVRPKDDTYEILLLRRNAKLNSFGGYYAFPGGIVEDQDTYEHWKDIAPDFVAKNDYFDFNKRVAAVRESFEEVNFLMASNSQDNLRPEYLKSPDFATFCHSK